MCDLSTWPVFSFVLIWLWSPTLVVMGYIFLLYIYKQLKVYLDKLFEMCVYVIVNLSYTYWDLLQVKFDGKKWFVINCTNSDGLDGFSH